MPLGLGLRLLVRCSGFRRWQTAPSTSDRSTEFISARSPLLSRRIQMQRSPESISEPFAALVAFISAEPLHRRPLLRQILRKQTQQS